MMMFDRSIKGCGWAWGNHYLDDRIFRCSKYAGRYLFGEGNRTDGFRVAG